MPDGSNNTKPGSHFLTSFTKLLILVFSGVFLVMKIAIAGPEHPVSYGSSRIDGLEHLLTSHNIIPTSGSMNIIS
jgi:hypothetical protein